MRLEPLDPSGLDAERRALQEEMKPAIDEHLQGFISQRADGTLLGPFPPLLQYPQWGAGFWAQTKALMEHTVLPKPAHEVAILVVGAAHRAEFELYAHQRVARDAGLAESKIATIVAGQRPADLTPSEGAAYDLAAALVRGGPVPDSTWSAALAVFGEQGAAEVVFLVAGYAAVCTVLNGFAMPVPGDDL